MENTAAKAGEYFIRTAKTVAEKIENRKSIIFHCMVEKYSGLGYNINIDNMEKQMR